MKAKRLGFGTSPTIKHRTSTSSGGTHQYFLFRGDRRLLIQLYGAICMPHIVNHHYTPRIPLVVAAVNRSAAAYGG